MKRSVINITTRGGKTASEKADDAETGIKAATTVLGAVSSKIVPGSDIVLDALGDFLADNVRTIIEQKDIARRTKEMIEHYNRVKNDTLLHPITRSKLLNIVRQQYNKNLTQEQKDEFLRQYDEILAEDKNLQGPRKPTGVPSKAEQQAKAPRSGIQENLVDKSGEKVYMVNKRFGKGVSKKQSKRAKQSKGSQVQSVLFPRGDWTKDQAYKWLADHAYKAYKLDKTDKYFRFRQSDPEKYDRFITKKITPSSGKKKDDYIKIVIGYRR